MALGGERSPLGDLAVVRGLVPRSRVRDQSSNQEFTLGDGGAVGTWGRLGPAVEGGIREAWISLQRERY